jgi:transposase
MNKYKEIFGVDISKDVFDVYGSKSVHNQFKMMYLDLCLF